VSALNNPEAAMTSLQSAGLTLEQARSAIERLVEVQASTLGVLHLFLASGVVFVIAAISVWFAPRPKQISMGGGH
jgi:DHA2 family multidrug resistance protein